MTASTAQPRVRQAHRIIERPRLLRLLDECSADVILLVAPAGYGKTTLARQWVRTLNRSMRTSCRPAHRDVAALAEEIASGIDSVEGDSRGFVRELLAAHPSPRRAAVRLAQVLAERIDASRVNWWFIDDYHELLASPEAEQFVEYLQANSSARLILASRHRPKWVASRHVMYGEVAELGRDTLAMTLEESDELLGRAARSDTLVQAAAGWPAVLTLAAAASDATPPHGVLPSALYRFFAEELFQRAPAALQEALLILALIPLSKPPNGDSLRTPTLEAAAELGFIALDDHPILNPLLREFLLQKVAETDDAQERIRRAIDRCTEEERWDDALFLITRFARTELIEPVLSRAIKPLGSRGRLATLTAFAATVRVAPQFPPPSVDIVEAESALHEGSFSLAAHVARRIRPSLAPDHLLRARVALIEGHSCLQLSRFRDAEAAFVAAQRAADDERDQTEALHGLALTRALGELGDVARPVAELWRRRHRSPVDLLRAATAELLRRRLEEGLAAPLPLEEAGHALTLVEDPRVRTSFAYGAAFSLAQQANYRDAEEWLNTFWADIETYDLEFARPHALWTRALVQIGLRRFREAERTLQTLEDDAAARHDEHQMINAQGLRARLLLQTGKAADAAAATAYAQGADLCPSWKGELLATRAMALAAIEDHTSARALADEASATSRMVEVRMLAAAARAISAASAGNAETAGQLLQRATQLNVWDPVVCALRSSRALSDALAESSAWRRSLESLYAATNDLGLARRAGFRTRATRAPAEILTPREFEILGLIAQGLRNNEIAEALFISPSTIKVHIRHIFEKLGARSRAEAVVRLELFSSSGAS